MVLDEEQGANRDREHTGAPPQRLCDLVEAHAARDGSRLALIEGGRRMSYAALSQACSQAAAFLAAREVRAGDRVLLVAENSIDCCFPRYSGPVFASSFGGRSAVFPGL